VILNVEGELATSLKAYAVKVEVAVMSNGKTYNIETQNGLPIGFKSKQLEMTGLGPGIEASTGNGQWYFGAEVKEAGDYLVTVTSHNDETLSTTFECKGPGRVLTPVFGRNQYPTMWTWFDEPGTSWVHFQFRFVDKNTGRSFVATQWTKFGPEAKINVKRALKRAATGQ
jgi:hypothetical protein